MLELKTRVSVSHSVVPTLCDPMDGSPPGFSVHEIFQARILEWVAISFSRKQEARFNFYTMGFPGGSDGKESACNVGDSNLIPGLGRSLGVHTNKFKMKQRLVYKNKTKIKKKSDR